MTFQCQISKNICLDRLFSRMHALMHYHHQSREQILVCVGHHFLQFGQSRKVPSQPTQLAVDRICVMIWAPTFASVHI